MGRNKAELEDTEKNVCVFFKKNPTQQFDLIKSFSHLLLIFLFVTKDCVCLFAWLKNEEELLKWFAEQEWQN